MGGRGPCNDAQANENGNEETRINASGLIESRADDDNGLICTLMKRNFGCLD